MTITELITEYQAKIDEIRFDMPAHEKMGGGKYYRHKLGMYEEFVRKLKEADVPRWIPCNERMPKDYEEVLVYSHIEDGIYVMYHIARDEWWESNDGEGFCFDDYYIAAWQPLPEPYKATGKEET